ncbi:MAG: PQQ-binding-like beta-propeller repeat protein [Sphingomonadales bacterium]
MRFGAVAVLGFLMVSLAAAQGDDIRRSDPASSIMHRVMQRDIQIDRENHPGRTLYDENCASCHDGSQPKAPHFEALQTMTPGAILSAMTDGIMIPQAVHLDAGQPEKIAEFLTGIDLASHEPEPGAVMCEGEARTFDRARPPIRAGWGYDNRRFVPARAAGMSADDVGRLEFKWAFAFPDAMRARSQPVVAMGAVFVGSDNGTIYAFDLETGCARWTSPVPAEVRTAIVVESWHESEPPAGNPRLFFGDLLGRVYAMDAITGDVLWRAQPEDHPNATITATPVLHDGKLIVGVSSLEMVTAADPNYACCTFRGSVAALDPESGEVIWKRHTIPDEPRESRRTSVGTAMLGPSGAAVWGSPTIDSVRGLIFHGTGQNYSTPADGNSNALFALDVTTGAQLWVRQIIAGDAWNSACSRKGLPNCPVENGPDFDLSASPLLIDLEGGGQILVAGQKSGHVTGIDPDTSDILWQIRIGRGGVQGGVHFGMAAEGQTVFVGINDLPVMADGSRAAEHGFPGIHAIDAATGAVFWQVIAADRCEGRQFCDTGISSAVTAMPGVVFAGYLDGWFRAHDSRTGMVLWEVDTTQPRPGTNGTVARGGSMSGPGAAIADGYVILNSGYGFSNHMPGNALLVYGVAR